MRLRRKQRFMRALLGAMVVATCVNGVEIALAQNTNQLTGVIRQAAPKPGAQQSSGNDLIPGTLQYDAAEKARQRLLEAADKEGGGAPSGGSPVIRMPNVPLGQNGNTIKIPTK